tara:strand:- start:273 stop:485 length:213 start_codon:yes stop_codon:yes gene_type:complete
MRKPENVNNLPQNVQLAIVGHFLGRKPPVNLNNAKKLLNKHLKRLEEDLRRVVALPSQHLRRSLNVNLGT